MCKTGDMQGKAEQGWAVLRGRHPMQCARVCWGAGVRQPWTQTSQVAESVLSPAVMRPYQHSHQPPLHACVRHIDSRSNLT